jgi:hypothetical protein
LKESEKKYPPGFIYKPSYLRRNIHLAATNVLTAKSSVTEENKELWKNFIGKDGRNYESVGYGP